MAPPKPSFEEVVHEHYEGVFRFALTLARNRSEAADLTQQAFLRYARKGHQIREAGKIKSWLLTVLRNEFLDGQRKKTRHPHVELQEVHEGSAETDCASRLDASAAMDALKALPMEYREPLALYLLQGYTYREISSVLDIPIGTVMSRLSRGKGKLRAALSQSSPTPQPTR